MKPPSQTSRTGKPRIVVVTRELEWGGTETHLMRVLPTVRSAGIDISLFLLERGGALEPAIVEGGVPVAGPMLQSGRIRHVVLAARELAHYIRNERPDAVHYFLPEPYVLGSLISPFAGRPLRLMSRRSLSDYQLKYPLLGTLERLLHRGTAAILGNSPAVVEQLIAEGNEPGKVGLINNGVPEPNPIRPATRERLRQELGLVDADLAFIVVANLIPYKGHADLLQAFAQASRNLPAHWRLLVVGKDNGILDALQQQSQSLGIADRVQWLGERRDVQDLLQVSDIAILPSHQEGSPNSLIEAMMAGLPIIATAVGGSCNLVQEGPRGNGILVPAKKPSELAKAIVQMAAQPDYARAAGLRGRALAQEHFSLEACINKYVSLYMNLSQLGRRPLSEILQMPEPGAAH